MRYKDIEFNSNRQLDLYPPGRSGRPLVVCVHGGGFVSGSRKDARCVQAATLLSEAGFNCATISYSLADSSDRFAQWPRNLFDLADAVAFLVANAGRYGYDAGRFALLGFSAGCCLSNLYIQGRADMLRQLGHDVSWHRPRALVGFYGPYDFSIRQPERRSADPEINRLHSPRHWLLHNEDSAPPPVLHVQGDADEIVYPEQHTLFEADCAHRGYAFEGMIAGGFGHSFAVRDRNARGETIDLGPKVVEFLERQLAGPAD